MLNGRDFDRLAQQRIFCERHWIDSQPGLVAQGRAVCLFVSRDTSSDDLFDLIDRFYRVFVFVAPGAKAAWMREAGSAGHRTYPFVVLVGREDNLEHCRRLALEEEPKLRGASILHLPDHADPRHLEQVQDLYAATKLFPQPEYFVAGADKTVLTSLLVDEEGVAIGTTMYHHLARVGPGYDSIACGLNSAIRPRRGGIFSAPRDRLRASSLAAWLNASAILRCREQFGVREIWSYAQAHNRRAIAFHHELGARQSEEVSCFCVEHRMALPDRWLAGHAPSLSDAIGLEAPGAAA